MTPEQHIKKFTKYINRILMPKYPDILSFQITYGDERKIKSIIYNPETPFYNFFFIMDGTEDDIEFKIRNEIFHMKDLFGDDFVSLFDFKSY